MPGICDQWSDGWVVCCSWWLAIRTWRRRCRLPTHRHLRHTLRPWSTWRLRTLRPLGRLCSLTDML